MVVLSFASVLNQYCGLLGSSNRELAARCGISASSLSRYRNGDREPDAGSSTVHKLAEGIAALAHEKGLVDLSNASELERVFDLNLVAPSTRAIDFGQRFDALLTVAGISNGEAAYLLSVDPSYVSRVRNCSRMPSDVPLFARRVAEAVISQCSSTRECDSVLELTGFIFPPNYSSLIKTASEEDRAEITDRIADWLENDKSQGRKTEVMRFFLREFSSPSALMHEPPVPDEGNLATYGDSPVRRQCFGVEQMREAEKEFLWRSIEAHVTRVGVISDMPFSLIDDVLFRSEERLRSFQILAEQGTRFVVVHNLDCPKSETLRRIALWMPLYLTGKVTSYYVDGMRSTINSQGNLGSPACTFLATAVNGKSETCWAFLSNDPEDIAFHETRFDNIMELASPFIEAYCEDDEERMEQFRMLESEFAKSVHHYDYAWPEYPNVTASVYPYECIVLTRTVEPVVHLVVRHPKLCRALYALSNGE